MSLVLSGFSVAAQGTMTFYQRQALDMSAYAVTDPDASYFDVAARIATLRDTEDHALRDLAERLSIEVGCQDKLALPVVDYNIALPSFYAQPREWRRLVQPIFAFEQAVSDLAGAYVASGDDIYFANCMADFLSQWAGRRAFETWDYRSDDRQAWHQVEGSLFAAAMAYSIVRPSIENRSGEKQIIEAWMLRLARRHVSYTGGNQSCCNNHLYRRATYAAMVGVLTGDNRLFRYGVSAIYSALNDANDDGALPHEMERGRLAAHYQNYAVMYLVMTAQIVEQQGYSIFDLEYDGHTLHDLVGYNIDLLEDPLRLGNHPPGAIQDLSWQEDDQYYAWAEIYLAGYPDERLEALIAQRRPLFNRSTGGYLTLFFKDPEEPTPRTNAHGALGDESDLAEGR